MAKRFPGSRRGGRCPAGKPLAGSVESGTLPAPDGAFDLEGFLRALDDGKLKHLQEEVQREARRRGWATTPPKTAGASPAAVAKELGIGRAQVTSLARAMKKDRQAGR